MNPSLRSPEATQLIYLRIPPSDSIDPAISSSFADLVACLKRQPGFQRMYWGRRTETPEMVQLHIVRSTLSHHHAFLSSPSFTTFNDLYSRVSPSAPAPTIRHALLHEYSPHCQSLGRGAPVTGTAVYLNITSEWDDAYTKAWSAIVQKVPGFMGIAGGYFEEEVGGGKAYIALVGWESTHVHDAYHLTRHFRRNAPVLGRGNGGYAEYGHVAFAYEL